MKIRKAFGNFRFLVALHEGFKGSFGMSFRSLCYFQFSHWKVPNGNEKSFWNMFSFEVVFRPSFMDLHLQQF